jgi:tetratricopeptide (TPR) repeat protein
MMKATESGAPVRKLYNKRNVRITISIAAGLFLIFLLYEGYYFYSLSPEKISNDQFKAYELPARSDDYSVKTDFENFFNRKDYRKVVSLKKKALNLSAKDQFLAGISYLELDDPMNAIVSLRAAINKSKDEHTNNFVEEAEYYLVLAYLKNKDYDQAIAATRAIQTNPNHLYHDKFSRDFIGKLKMLKWR